MPTDNIANRFTLGDIVNVPCVVTALSTPQVGVSLLTLTPKYKTPNGTTPSTITSVYATQVLLDK
jgi:hypothetical protein